MSEEELYHKLLFDLTSLNMPIDEVDLELRPYSKSFYGRYFPVKDDTVTRPKIFIYPYENKRGVFMSYDNILDTAIHELVHHIQYCDKSFKRLKGVMHNADFWKLYNHYLSRAKRFQMIKEVTK